MFYTVSYSLQEVNTVPFYNSGWQHVLIRNEVKLNGNKMDPKFHALQNNI